MLTNNVNGSLPLAAQVHYTRLKLILRMAALDLSLLQRVQIETSGSIVSRVESSDVVVDAVEMVLFQTRGAIMRELCTFLDLGECERILLTGETYAIAYMVSRSILNNGCSSHMKYVRLKLGLSSLEGLFRSRMVRKAISLRSRYHLWCITSLQKEDGGRYVNEGIQVTETTAKPTG